MRTETDALLSLQRYVAAALPDMTEVLTVLEDESPERPFAVVAADDGWAPDENVNQPTVTMPATIYVYVQGETRKAAREAAEQAREAIWHALAVGIGDGRPRLIPLFDYSGRPTVQGVSVVGAKAGDWTLAQDDENVTDPLPLNAQPRDLRLALEALPGLDGNVWVYGKLGGPWAVRFDGDLRGQDVPLLVGDPTGLVASGDDDPEVIVTADVAGSPDPWRDPRDFLRVSSITPGGLPDVREPRNRTVTIGLRLTWGRGGRVPSAEMTLRTITARPI